MISKIKTSILISAAVLAIHPDDDQRRLAGQGAPWQTSLKKLSNCGLVYDVVSVKDVT